MAIKQQMFDFFEDRQVSVPPAKSLGRVEALPGRNDFRRAVMGWLLRQNPTGMAAAVPTRISRYHADLAAFWSASGGRRNLLSPVRTMIIEFRSSHEDCWPDCGNRGELIARLREMKRDKETLEEGIRKTEPELMEGECLFDEFRNWDYRRSANPEYQRCLKKIEKLEHTLYKGSRLEQIRAAHVADLHYLAVPENTVQEDELAFGWGLLHVDAGFRVSVRREATPRDCPAENRLHLIQNIAAAAMHDSLVANGIRIAGSGRITYHPIPRRRRKLEGEYQDCAE